MDDDVVESARSFEAMRARARNAPGWSCDHQAAIQAKPGQAPQMSWAYRIEHPVFGQTIHVLSRAEYVLVFLALYSDKLFCLWDQFRFDVLPGPHPLHGHPGLVGQPIRQHRGTLMIAKELGVVSSHPKAFVVQKGSEEGGAWVPRPMLGDFLLFLLDNDGPYCVHLDIKSNAAAHGKPGPERFNVRAGVKRNKNAVNKNAIKAQYMAELGIRQVFLHPGLLDTQVACNLRFLFQWTVRSVELGFIQQQELAELFRTALRLGTPPALVIARCASRWGWSATECRRLLFQSIWRRELRVDLFDAILVDRALQPERRDVLLVYENWFMR